MAAHGLSFLFVRAVVCVDTVLSSNALKARYDGAYRDFYRWGNIARAAWSHDGLKHRAKRFAYAAGWKKFEPLWDMVIKAQRQGGMTSGGLARDAAR